MNSDTTESIYFLSDLMRGQGHAALADRLDESARRGPAGTEARQWAWRWERDLRTARGDDRPAGEGRP